MWIFCKNWNSLPPPAPPLTAEMDFPRMWGAAPRLVLSYEGGKWKFLETSEKFATRLGLSDWTQLSKMNFNYSSLFTKSAEKGFHIFEKGMNLCNLLFRCLVRFYIFLRLGRQNPIKYHPQIIIPLFPDRAKIKIFLEFSK